MIKVAIVDDEKNSREILKRLILETGLDIEIIGEADSVETGYKMINDKLPQVIFLDVEMLDGTGFDLLEKFDKINFEIIFSTAYDKYAIKAFRYSALDYLLKPIDLSELEEAIGRVSINNEGQENSSIKLLLENIRADSQNKKIALKSASKIDFVEIDKIICLKAEGSYTELIIEGDRRIMSTNPLKYFDSMFDSDSNFFRLNKSCMINMKHIKVYKKGVESLELDNGLVIEIARRRRKEFLERFNLI